MRAFFQSGLSAAAAALCMLGIASADDIVDQEQLLISSTPSAVGGGSDQKIAQSFTVGVNGALSQLRLPIGCSSGEMLIEIQRLDANGEPSGVTISSARMRAEVFETPLGDFETVFLSPAIPVRAGDELAFVLTSEDGACSILRGPPGDTYAGGNSFYDARPNPPGWVGGKRRPGPVSSQGDYPFQTVVDDGRGGSGSSNLCFGDVGNGPVPLPIIYDLPICRCLEDPIANEFRCRLVHPDFFMSRTIPLPPFSAKLKLIPEEWAFTPLTELDGPVTVTLPMGPNEKPLIHQFGKRSKPGSFEFLGVNHKVTQSTLIKPGAIGISYPMKDASSPFQKDFQFDPSFEPQLKKQGKK